MIWFGGVRSTVSNFAGFRLTTCTEPHRRKARTGRQCCLPALALHQYQHHRHGGSACLCCCSRYFPEEFEPTLLAQRQPLSVQIPSLESRRSELADTKTFQCDGAFGLALIALGAQWLPKLFFGICGMLHPELGPRLQRFLVAWICCPILCNSQATAQSHLILEFAVFQKDCRCKSHSRRMGGQTEEYQIARAVFQLEVLAISCFSLTRIEPCE